MMHGAIFHAALTAALAVGGTSVHATARFADIVVLMDESGSMSGEQAWMRFAVPGLDAGLQARGLIGNAFGLVGFSAFSAPAPSRLRTFDVGNGLLGTSSDWVLASNGLVDRGDIEDGWAAIAATSSYPFRGSAARNLILVTDEDRDNTNAGLSFEGLLAAMKATNTLLNVVVNHTFRCGDRSLALGIVGTTGYKADGSGGFAKCEGAFPESNRLRRGAVCGPGARHGWWCLESELSEVRRRHCRFLQRRVPRRQGLGNRLAAASCTRTLHVGHVRRWPAADLAGCAAPSRVNCCAISISLVVERAARCTR